MHPCLCSVVLKRMLDLHQYLKIVILKPDVHFVKADNQVDSISLEINSCSYSPHGHE